MKKKIKRKKKKPQDENIMSASATQGGHNYSCSLLLRQLLLWLWYDTVGWVTGAASSL